MSKEMMVIALGFWVIVVRTLLGVPGSWQTVLLIATGVALAVLGFQLRGEALLRSGAMRRDTDTKRSGTYPFVESDTSQLHENKEGISPLN